MSATAPSYDIVIPSLGRASLGALLSSLDVAGVDRVHVRVVIDFAHQGPAACRNQGACCARSPWIVFLDDDVRVAPGWKQRLESDLAACPPDVVAVQGQVRVPRPMDRRMTDWERNTARLEDAQWVTADMAVRRDAFEDIGGFDQRFRRAYREDSDLVLRLQARGGKVRRGSRVVYHPVRPEGFFVSLRAQRGNADDRLLRAIHGKGVRRALGEGRSVLPAYVGVSLVGLAALVTTLAGRRRASRACAAAYLAWTLGFALRRIAPGPRDAAEVTRMAITSALIPPVATWHSLRGLMRWGLAARS